jgi:hypothetical protein
MKRLAILTRELDPEHEAAIRAAWSDRIREARLDSRRRADRLASLGCATAYAPYVARSILERLASFDLGDAAGPFLARLADAASCPGTRGLTDAERVNLAQRAASALPPTPRPNVSASTP